MVSELITEFDLNIYLSHLWCYSGPPKVIDNKSPIRTLCHVAFEPYTTDSYFVTDYTRNSPFLIIIVSTFSKKSRRYVKSGYPVRSLYLYLHEINANGRLVKTGMSIGIHFNL